MDDLVNRLRVLNHHAKKLAENESLHELYREAFTRCEDLTWEAANEIRHLRQERDQARRMFCVHASGAGKIYFTGNTPQQIADYFNWYDSPQEEKQHDVEE